MRVEMTCSGATCDAYFNMEDESGENDNAILLFAHRFANAHAPCGFMAPYLADGSVPQVVEWVTDGPPAPPVLDPILDVADPGDLDV